MGGMCDEPLQAENINDIMEVGMKHLEAAHPQMAADIKAMPIDDPMMKKWSEDFTKTWENTLDI